MTDTAAPTTDTEPDWTKAGAPPEPDTAPAVETAETPGAEVVPISQARQQFDRAEATVLAMPGMPGRDEFLSLAAQARVLSMSGAAPKAIRNNPHVAFHVAMVGRDLGISPSAAIALIDVIGDPDTDKVSLSLSPELLNGQIKRLGLGKIVPAVSTEEQCIAVVLGPGGHLDPRCKRSYPEHVDDCQCHGILGDGEFTWADAQMAGLAGRTCTPTDHKVASGKSYCVCRQGWRTYPKRMCWWRASGNAASDYFPEASLGLYQPEELGAVVDVEGRPIDPATVELPPGYEPEPARGSSGDDAPVSPEVSWSLQQRIYSLPADAQEEFRKRWKQAKVPGNVRHFPAAKAQLVEAFLRGVESQWKAQGGFDPDAALATTIGRLGEAVVATLQVWPAGTPAPKAAPTPTGAPEGDAATSPASGAGVAQAALLPAEVPTTAEPAQAATGTTTAPLAGDFDPDAWMDRVTSAERGEATVDDVIDYATGEVKKLKLPEVNAALVAAAASTDGAADDRRARLAALVCTALGVPVADQS